VGLQASLQPLWTRSKATRSASSLVKNPLTMLISCQRPDESDFMSVPSISLCLAPASCTSSFTTWRSDDIRVQDRVKAEFTQDGLALGS
jgi:hypothetical protein